ncbi:AAA family ATPase [Synechococcales cyanobacterium C]|uniref:AAA family ATPase n=1 Tax=Petrachloros mirabilis ULC683 TaxID=2781853 RepID=A0A8K1ZYW2_9CYAN|nr:AAA family ATPase [Petrachloros mirabilis]NCJ06646.1 AAA family ATPase [Petrachloros mirabilis ULC683]
MKTGLNHIAIRLKNIYALADACRDLLERGPGVPGFGLCWGATGMGKTTAVAYQTNQFNAIYLTATPFWSANAMLSKILIELGGVPRGSASQLHDLIVQRLQENPRLIFIDEADFIFENSARRTLVEGLRSLHDMSGAPFVLVGMDKVVSKLELYPQLHGRVSRFVEFRNLDLGDLRQVVEAACEIKLSDCLLERLHEATRGRLRQAVTAISRIEPVARLNDWQEVTAELWGDEPFFLKETP